MPTGEITKPATRGQITIPSGYRKKLGITPDTLLNIVELDGALVIIPVQIIPEEGLQVGSTDWTDQKVTVETYMQTVRRNPLEMIKARRLREGW